MASTPAQRRAGMIYAMRFAGIPVDESKLDPLGPDADVPTVGPWPPVTDAERDMAARVAIGIPPGGGSPSSDDIVEDMRSIKLNAYFIPRCMQMGARPLAIATAARTLVIAEKLARHGSEDAAASLLMMMDLLTEDAIADEAVAEAQKMLEGVQS